MIRAVVCRPVELVTLKLWPLVISMLWISILLTGGVLGYRGAMFGITAALALGGSLAHFLFPFNLKVRYVALVVNGVAMLGRATDYALAGHRWQIIVAGAAVWLTILAGKIGMFLLSASLVESQLAHREINGE